MRRLSLGLCAVLLSTAFYVACSAFGGSDANVPQADASATGDGSAATTDGSFLPTNDGGGAGDAGGIDGGADAACSPVLFELSDCTSLPQLSEADGGFLTPSMTVPPGGSGQSCAFSLNPGGSASFETTFNTYIGATTILEFMVEPNTAHDVALLGCSVSVHAGTQTQTMTLAYQTGQGGQVALHTQDTGAVPAVDANNVRILQMDTGKDLALGGWNKVTFTLGKNSQRVDLLTPGNGGGFDTYGFTSPASTTGQITLKCGAISTGTDFGVLIDSIKLTTARCN